MRRRSIVPRRIFEGLTICGEPCGVKSNVIGVRPAPNQDVFDSIVQAEFRADPPREVDIVGDFHGREMGPVVGMRLTQPMHDASERVGKSVWVSPQGAFPPRDVRVVGRLFGSQAHGESIITVYNL